MRVALFIEDTENGNITCQLGTAKPCTQEERDASPAWTAARDCADMLMKPRVTDAATELFLKTQETK